METENRTELTGDTVSRAGSSVCELTNQRTSGYTGGGGVHVKACKPILVVTQRKIMNLKISIIGLL